MAVQQEQQGGLESPPLYLQPPRYSSDTPYCIEAKSRAVLQPDRFMLRNCFFQDGTARVSGDPLSSPVIHKYFFGSARYGL